MNVRDNKYVDTTETITLLEWCAGYGGIGLGLKAIYGSRLRTIGYSDVEGFVQANLISKMEAGLLDVAPIWPNLKTFPCEEFYGLVDIFVAGYPCQPFSHAGKRAGDEDPRHLFPYIKRAAEVMRPGLIFLENVEGLLSAKLAGNGWADPAGTPVLVHIFRELERVGYCCTAGLFSASEVGAPHQRKRVFILAYDKNTKRELSGTARAGGTGLADGCDEDVAHQQHEGLQGRGGECQLPKSSEQMQIGGRCSHGKLALNRDGGRKDGVSGQDNGKEGNAEEFGNSSQAWPSRPGQAQYGWEPPRVVGNMEHPKSRQNHKREPGNMEQEARNGRGGEDAAGGAGRREVEPPLGRDFDGPAAGLDFPGCTGLSDTELEEIYGWMVKGTNRTDELRMCGNGVVPQTAALAWRTLYRELMK